MRYAELERNTKETKVFVRWNLDGSGKVDIHTGVGFFDHMLELLAFHSHTDLTVKADGDLNVDDHHTIEDIGIVMGTVFRNALGDRKGIARYGFMVLPMDEVLAETAIDISGRPYLVFNCDFTRENIGAMSTEMAEEFFRAFAVSSGTTLHINVRYGQNDHHRMEGIFKSFARTIRQAIRVEGNELPSTKGMLE
ncbi:MAG: imidazoleglycerol-phosphate dehydratase HisB [Bulleidia sp.]